MDEPLRHFSELYEQAKELIPRDPNGMVLSTVSAEGRPSSRVVLLKDFDQRGFVFFTNYQSRKGRELIATRVASLLFWWAPLEKQVRIEGPVEQVPDAESDAYFQTRPRGSQLGAWASHQSAPLGSREELEARVAELDREYQGREIPRPPHWGGFRLAPQLIEFWTGRQSRLHERIVYTRAGDGWSKGLLNP